MNLEIIQIGNQKWTKENIKLVEFSDGSKIVKAKNMAEWKDLNIQEIPACCTVDFDDKNLDKYGLIYNIHCILSKISLAPNGFKIPLKSDWDILIEFLGGKTDCLNKLKSTKGWLGKMNGDNSSGFDAKPSGDLFIGIKFRDVGYGTSWITLDQYIPHITQYDKENFCFHNPSKPNNIEGMPNYPPSGNFIRLISND